MMTARRLLTSAVLLCTVAFASTASAADEPKKDDKADEKKADEKKTEESAAGDVGDVTELAHKTYYFVGARYRGTVVPKFMMNLFVDEGATFYSNTIGIELDMRKDAESKIFALNYVEYGMGDTLFLEKNKDRNNAGNWSYVNSSLKGIYATIDLLWSTPIANHFDFEYGFGAGIGFIFGDLINNWVYADPNGSLKSADGSMSFSKCTGDGVPNQLGCHKGDHPNADVAKAAPGGYVEKTWFSGGSVPNIFLHLAFPELGVRYKINRDVETRLGLGFSLTGFWFGLSADYGLPQNKKEAAKNAPTFRFGNANQRQTL